MHTPDAENDVFNIAASFIRQSNHPVFLTGKAGTGKTTFLKYIREQKFKNTAIVAPTGVAAINAGGTTIHSFFSLPLSPFIPAQRRGFQPEGDSTDKNSLLGKMKLSQEKKDIIQKLELLIIDEISMVRCDVLDAIDTVMRHVRSNYHQPFGGAQILYIGDMYQLPPVVKDNEWSILSQYYNGPFFFNSQVCTENPPVYIELKKVYRQSDEGFINLLNQVRNNDMDEEGYELLHNRCMPGFSQEVANKENIITLTTHNYKADAINEGALRSLPGQEHNFKATIEGEFYEKSYPAEDNLRLKKGAQVMFLKNDVEKTRRYFNGKIGIVSSLSDDKIEVLCNDGSEKIEVRRDNWKTIKYTLNKTKQHIEEEELGSFTQFPLRLAWAITIHKSQGLTFEKAIIDAGNAFAPGQVYVALSRCTQMDGLFLKSKITYNSLQSDERIVAFARNQKDKDLGATKLADAIKKYQEEIIISLIDFKNIERSFTKVVKVISENFIDDSAKTWINTLTQLIAQYSNYSLKFIPVLESIFLKDESVLPENNAALQDRLSKAAEWFSKALKTFLQLLAKLPVQTDNRGVAKEVNEKLQALFDEVNLKIHLLNGIEQGFKLDDFLKHKMQYEKKSFGVNCYSGRSSFIPQGVKHYELYFALKEKRDELCVELSLPVYMVCNAESIEIMSNSLPQNLNDLEKIPGFGKHRLKKFGKEFLNIVQEYCLANNLEGNMKNIPTKRIRKSSSLSERKPDTKKTTFGLFRQGMSIAEIANYRNLAQSTIEGHLAFYIENGSLHITDLMTEERKKIVETILKDNAVLTYSEVKANYPEINYSEIRWIMASAKLSSSN
ncbi:MAG: helix-turn-helix domain-containing protein [Ferruginibacter sp.]